MKDRSYWKERYVLETDPDEVESHIKRDYFPSNNTTYELICYERGKSAPNILISMGSGGHAYVFAELGYRMHQAGYNVFIMPKHGGYTLNELILRHKDALEHISNAFNDRIGIYGEGLGGYATFYLALAASVLGARSTTGPNTTTESSTSCLVKSIVCQNSPAITTERRYLKAITEGPGSALRRSVMLPLASVLVRVLPNVKLPISTYLDWKELIDTKEGNRSIERRLVMEGYLRDPDFDRWYPLSAIWSLVSTPPPSPLSELRVPTMFLVSMRGVIPSYFKGLYDRLPPIRKRMIEIDGSVYWMLSHPKEAARVICEWFDETLGTPTKGDPDIVGLRNILDSTFERERAPENGASDKGTKMGRSDPPAHAGATRGARGEE